MENNYKMLKTVYILVIILILLQGCAPVKVPKQLETTVVRSDNFEDYWYNHGAELTHYRLEQARYGEIHQGDAVLIFVTEPFLPDKQVKADNPESHPQIIPILKLNFTKKFYTGIYPYSIMSSTFTPINIEQYPHTLKVAASTQEWCGQVYSQLNIRGDIYKILSLSYFEKEVSDIFELETAFLEDEIWTRIRIDPDTLPQGRIKMIPGLLTARLSHIKLKVETVEASLVNKGDDLSSYILDYKGSERKLVINFNKYFPHQIVSWEETYKSGRGNKAKILTTKAVKTHSIMTDYWNKNTNKDAYLREQLGL
jgi:hypothetical protein